MPCSQHIKCGELTHLLLSFLYTLQCAFSNILLKLNELVSSSARLYFPKWLQRCFHLPCTSRILSLCFLPACADWAFVTVWTTRMGQKWHTLHSQARLGQVALCLELSTLGILSPGFNKPRSRGPSSRPVADARQ